MVDFRQCRSSAACLRDWHPEPLRSRPRRADAAARAPRSPSFRAAPGLPLALRRAAQIDATWTDLPRALRERLRSASSSTRAPRRPHRGRRRHGQVPRRASPRRRRSRPCPCCSPGGVTLCLSSQVGCALACDFCLTGTMGLVAPPRRAGEIVGQVALLQADRGLQRARSTSCSWAWASRCTTTTAVLARLPPADRPRRASACRRPAHHRLHRRPRAGDRAAGRRAGRPRLAVSLNATTDELRDRLMPINRALAARAAARGLPALPPSRGRADHLRVRAARRGQRPPTDVRRLGAILRGVRQAEPDPVQPRARALPYRPPPRQRVLAFRDRCSPRGLPVSIRWSRGGEARRGLRPAR